MRFAAAFSLVLSFSAFGQTPPRDVDEALRSRVKEFFGYHVTGEFRKAMNLVAQETQDEYFAAQKTRYEGFQIDSIEYSDNFTKAVVTLTVKEKKRISVQFPETVFVEKPATLWKIEDGKWCFYIEHKTTWRTPMGPSDLKAIDQARAQAANGVPFSPDQIKDLASTILNQSTISRSDVILPPDRPSSEEIVFKNGQNGTVKLYLASGKLPEGMTAELDKTDVPANGQATLKITYKPRPDIVPPTVSLTLVMEPFSRSFPISVRFTPVAQ